MNRRKGAAAFISIGCLFLIAALSLGGYNLWDDRRAEQAVSGILEQLAEKQPEPEPEPTPDYLLNPYMDMPTVEIDG